VKNHVTSLLAKLGVQRRTQAAVLASERRRRRA
jgi:two-component system, NarL family, response regulator DevR